ncbi:MAG: hypothetical protein HYX77_04905 [Acidobacteria bacterium]|nr:hypothetical protein [Acidobacteriota bacterium]
MKTAKTGEQIDKPQGNNSSGSTTPKGVFAMAFADPAYAAEHPQKATARYSRFADSDLANW